MNNEDENIPNVHHNKRAFKTITVSDDVGGVPYILRLAKECGINVCEILESAVVVGYIKGSFEHEMRIKYFIGALNETAHYTTSDKEEGSDNDGVK